MELLESNRLIVLKQISNERLTSRSNILLSGLSSTQLFEIIIAIKGTGWFIFKSYFKMSSIAMII